MPEAVIVSTARTPIGRAAKGSLVDARPDDLIAFAIKSALDKVPELPQQEIVDVMIGCGFPQERQGMNLARRAALLAELPETVPGTTVNRKRCTIKGRVTLRVVMASEAPKHIRGPAAKGM